MNRGQIQKEYNENEAMLENLSDDLARRVIDETTYKSCRGRYQKKRTQLKFEKALEYFGTKAQKAIIVGDSYEKDVIGAIRSGITPIWYTPHSAPKNRTYEGKIIEVINQFDKKSFLTLLEK